MTDSAMTVRMSLVVIGSSAGGIDVLSTLVAALPADFPAPIICAQHLEPSRVSHLAEILARVSTLPVRLVEAEVVLEPGVVYIGPSDHDVVVNDGLVSLDVEGVGRSKPSIDRLLTSAAHAFGEQLIALILTGSGSDGAAGARDVKAAGGTVVVQNPETANYPAMPQSLAPNTVDIVVDVENAGKLLYELVTRLDSPEPPDEARTLGALLDHLRDRSGIDFGSYKRPTILRRFHRRMVATRQTSLEDYRRYIQTHPDERHRLVSSFLIKVTEFFRDPDLFTYLRERVLPELVDDARSRGRELRIWAAGCATGEEAYSLAILLAEHLGDDLEPTGVRIFATDLDSDAVAFARRGVYPASALAAVPPEMVQKYFNEHDGAYEIKKRIRVMTVFGQHDLGQRAPFPRIDLAFCRNVLIYFTGELQKRALQLFAFSLRTDGYLVLGQAETTSPLADLFSAEDTRLRVYRRVGERVLIPTARTREGTPTPSRPGLDRSASLGADDGGLVRESGHPTSIAGRAESLLYRLPIGVVLVDRRYDIVSINAHARRCFGIHGTAIGDDFIHLAQGIDSAPLRSAIDAAFRGQAPASLAEVAVPDPRSGEVRYLDITCQPERTDNGMGPVDFVLVTVADVTPSVLTRRRLQDDAAQQRAEVARLATQTERLTEANRNLLDANQDLTATNAELRSANEEFLISSEEAQAATEELETLNEEMQATNEELETLNEELQSTVEELNTTNDDLQARSIELQDLAISLETQRQESESERARLSAVLLSMADAVLVVGRDGQLVLTNPAYDALFGAGGDNLVLRDTTGRPLPPDQTPRGLAVRGEPFRIEFVLDLPDGSRRWFEANGRPIDRDGVRDAVVVIRDVSAASLRHLQEEFLSVVGHELRGPLTALKGYLQLLERRATSLDAAAADLLARSIEQTRRLAGLIGELADLARSQRGELTVAPVPTDLVPLVRGVVDVARFLTETQTIELTIEPETLVATADARRIEQVLLNLLTNAIRHSGSSDRIDVRLRRVGARAEIHVQDYGVGIAPADLPSIFDRFYQVGREPSQGGGLGLGLYISRQIVQAHGGTIEVASRPREGATFTVRLPLPQDDSPG